KIAALDGMNRIGLALKDTAVRVSTRKKVAPAPAAAAAPEGASEPVIVNKLHDVGVQSTGY
ncbi:MAG: hypothetical protein SH809_06585, partial [Rhodothermales bacterium]|nr:hypothetical protein [Rhodothermales bacterium]